MDRDQIEAKYDILSAKASGAPDEPWTECVALDDVMEIAQEAEQRGIDRAVDVEVRPPIESMADSMEWAACLHTMREAIRNLEVPTVTAQDIITMDTDGMED